VYAAKLGAARLARALEIAGRADALEREAEQLRERFEDAFWCEDLGTYALALDGAKRRCEVVTSNPGHCLFTGIASEERARAVAQTLMAPESFSGWGVRTVAARQIGYNPMSYHNGSVWPHDNAIIAAGLARYGLKGAASNILTGLFDSSIFFESHRLPELFCGFPRRPDEPPTLYPVACSPQAWAATAVFLCLQACLGVDVVAGASRITFRDPVLPQAVDWMHIRDLQVAEGSVDLVLTRRIDQAVIGIEGRRGKVSVITVR
jgi:glycogen debranching enzyme